MVERRFAASVAMVDKTGNVLFWKRSMEKSVFPWVLSLPSTYIRSKEWKIISQALWEEVEIAQLTIAVKRKLWLSLTKLVPIWSMEAMQWDYLLHMTDYITMLPEEKIVPNQKDYSDALLLPPMSTLSNIPTEDLWHCTRTLLTVLKDNPNLIKEFISQ